MAQIRDSSVIKTPQVTVDPRFSFPGDVIDLKQTDSDDYSPVSFDDNDSSESIIDLTLDQTIPSSDALSEPEHASNLGTPQTLTVLSQTVRISPDGTSVVDVLLQVEDVFGANTYELRVTK